jgi:hypothetical protein
MRNIDQALWRSRDSRRGGLLPCSILTLVCLLLLTSCRQPGNGCAASSTSAENQPAANTIAGALIKVQMIDASIGWAVSWNLAGTGAYHILKTTDGGHHWKPLLQCLPTQELGKGFLKDCATDFHSALVATVVQPEYDSQTQTARLRIFHTSDGGQTWQSSVLAARDLVQHRRADGCDKCGVSGFAAGRSG